MRIVTVALFLGLLAACAVWAQDAGKPAGPAPAPGGPGAAGPGPGGPTGGPGSSGGPPPGQMMNPEMMKQMQANAPAANKKKVPIVGIAVGVALVALVAALVLKKGGAGKS